MFTVSTTKNGFKLIVTDELDEIGRQVCGAFCCRWNETAAENLPAVPAVVGEKVIFICQFMVDKMTPAELLAVIGHEEGHLALGHIEKWEAQGITGAAVDPEAELEADAYSAQHYGGGEVLAVALEKIKPMVIDFLIAAVAVVVAREAITSEVMKALDERIEALHN